MSAASVRQQCSMALAMLPYCGMANIRLTAPLLLQKQKKNREQRMQWAPCCHE